MAKFRRLRITVREAFSRLRAFSDFAGGRDLIFLFEASGFTDRRTP
jgi:hypothetical protein